jgi:hypothetical protein
LFAKTIVPGWRGVGASFRMIFSALPPDNRHLTRGPSSDTMKLALD